MLRDVAKGKHLNLQELINTLESDRARLSLPYEGNVTLSACPVIFPLLTALVHGAVASTDAQTKRSPEEWATRALLEAAGLQVSTALPSPAV